MSLSVGRQVARLLAILSSDEHALVPTLRHSAEQPANPRKGFLASSQPSMSSQSPLFLHASRAHQLLHHGKCIFHSLCSMPHHVFLSAPLYVQEPDALCGVDSRGPSRAARGCDGWTLARRLRTASSPPTRGAPRSTSNPPRRPPTLRCPCLHRPSSCCVRQEETCTH
jgi:hypothetical protein